MCFLVRNLQKRRGDRLDFRMRQLLELMVKLHHNIRLPLLYKQPCWRWHQRRQPSLWRSRRRSSSLPLQQGRLRRWADIWTSCCHRMHDIKFYIVILIQVEICISFPMYEVIHPHCLMWYIEVMDIIFSMFMIEGVLHLRTIEFWVNQFTLSWTWENVHWCLCK